LTESEYLDDLVELARHSNDRNNGVIRQYQSALMHYNELQLRSVEVEAMAMKFEQRVADEVAKAGYRQKPGPRQKKKMSTAIATIRRGKSNHSEWTSQEMDWARGPRPGGLTLRLRGS
jgi:hypothetical protein